MGSEKENGFGNYVVKHPKPLDFLTLFETL